MINFQTPLIECGDSSKSQVNQIEGVIPANCDIIDLNDDEKTPCSKKSGKRSAEKAIANTNGSAEVGKESTKKPVKLKCVKKEPSE